MKTFDRFKYFFEPQNGQLWEKLHDPSENPKFFTASGIANVLGCGHESGAKEYDFRKGIRPYDPFLRNNNPILQFGHKNEARATQDFYKKYPEFHGMKPGMILHPTRSDIGASLDQIMTDQHNKLWNLEVKCKFNGEIYEIPEKIPFKYLVQMTIQNFVTGIDNSVLWVWTPQKQEAWFVPSDTKLMKAIEKGLDVFIDKFNNNKRPNRTSLSAELNHLLTDLRSRIKSF